MTPQPSSTARHVVDRLAEYFGGALTTADDAAVEAHLLVCAECRAEFDDLGAIALAIALQPYDVRHDVRDDAVLTAGPPGTTGQRRVAEAPATPGAAEPPTTVWAAEPPTAATPTSRPPTGQPTRGSSGPGRRSTGGPTGHRRPSRLRRLAGYAVVLVAGATLGIGGMTLVNQFDNPRLQTVGDDRVISTQGLSVMLTESADGTRIQAAAVGLRPSRAFRLVAIDTDGQAHLVTTGVTNGGLVSVVGTVPVPASRIVFVALVEHGGGALLVARPS
jgi:anti-sigma factor RsiW